jgi:hypothetical protein
MRSFILLIARRKVLLPHPLGPIIAVTLPAGIEKVTSQTAAFPL